MTASTIKLAASAVDHQVARMAALARPVGAGSRDTVAAAGRQAGPRQHRDPDRAGALWLAHGRMGIVIAGSRRRPAVRQFSGTGIFLSLSGALCSLAILAAVQHLPARWFGAVTHSICAAAAHIAGQFLLVYFWLIPHAWLAYLIPIFTASGVIFGTVNGLVAAWYLAGPALQQGNANTQTHILSVETGK
jgi:heptaprenyl diphosphate synthase